MLLECLAMTVSSVIIGYLVGYIEVLVGLSLMRTGLEMDLDYDPYIGLLFLFLTITVAVIAAGVMIATKPLMNKGISKLLRGL